MLRRTAAALAALQAFAATAAHAQDQQDQDQLWGQLQNQSGGQGGASSGGLAGTGQRIRIVPYIEVGQVLTTGQGDTLTYTTLSAGIDASVQTRRVAVQLDYQYQRQFSESKGGNSFGVNTGTARARIALIPGLSLDAGGIATLTNTSPVGPTAVNTVGNAANLSQVYSGNIGPTLHTKVGPFALDANYLFNYTKVDTPNGATNTIDNTPVNVYDSSWMQQAGVGIGFKPGTLLPIGLRISGSWTQQDTDQLEQHYASAYFRGDVTVPLGGGLSLIGNIGYEHTLATQRAPLLNSAGQPVLDSSGRYVTDPNNPTTYTDFAADGILWGVGLSYHPSPRFSVEATVGQTNYGSMSYTGSLSYNNGHGVNTQIQVFDQESSFGMALSDGLTSLPTSAWSTVNPSGGLTGMNSCSFTSVVGQSSTCMNSILQSVTTNNYRARGVTAALSVATGRNHLGIGLGYQNSLYQAPVDIPNSVNGQSTDSYSGNAFFAHQFSRRAGVQLTVLAGYQHSNLLGADSSSWSEGASGSFTYRLGHLGLYATLGVTDAQVTSTGTIAGTDMASGVSVQGMAGARYSF